MPKVVKVIKTEEEYIYYRPLFKNGVILSIPPKGQCLILECPYRSENTVVFMKTENEKLK